jgi:hypothetical protein
LLSSLLRKAAIILANQRYGKRIEGTPSFPFPETSSLSPSNRLTRVVSSLLQFLLKMEAALTSKDFWDFELIRWILPKIVFKTLAAYDRLNPLEAEHSPSFVQFACIMK